MRQIEETDVSGFKPSGPCRMVASAPLPKFVITPSIPGHELREAKGHQQVYDASAAFRFEVPKRGCRGWCRNFKSAALDCRNQTGEIDVAPSCRRRVGRA